jgi:hypothetical protein
VYCRSAALASSHVTAGGWRGASVSRTGASDAEPAASVASATRTQVRPWQHSDGRPLGRRPHSAPGAYGRVPAVRPNRFQRSIRGRQAIETASRWLIILPPAPPAARARPCPPPPYACRDRRPAARPRAGVYAIEYPEYCRHVPPTRGATGPGGRLGVTAATSTGRESGWQPCSRHHPFPPLLPLVHAARPATPK